MKGIAVARVAALWLSVSMVFGGVLVGATSAKAATVGSNLGAGANDSVCKYQSPEPETRVCTIGQLDLISGHTAIDGLVAPFDGVIVRWSVVTGTSVTPVEDPDLVGM